MEALLKLLEDRGVSEEIRSQLRAQLKDLLPEESPSLETLLSRLSLLRTFTRTSYDISTQDLADAPDFEDFATHTGVEPVIGYPGRYAVAERVRTDHLNKWLQQPDERAQWAKRFAKSLDVHDPIERFDRIQIVFLGDQVQARKVLIKAFEEAEAANDIAQCSGLVELAGSMLIFCDGESTTLINQLRGRSKARNLFFTEFYQSERYFPRPIDQQIREFASATDDQWIFHLYATGGMGKTTMLRRLISHEWVRGKKHAPCAMLDFDYLDVSTVLQQPTLLGLAMAAQWNEQLEQPVFGGILVPSFRPLASLLFRTRTDASARGLSSAALEDRARNQYLAGLSNPMRCGILAGAVPPRTLEERTSLMKQTKELLTYWTDKLPEAMANMPTDRPVLLILDTLEDASQPHGEQLLKTLHLLAELRESARAFATILGRPPINLRLILSGRHRLGEEHVVEFAKEFDGQYTVRALSGLESPEAATFLDQAIRKEIDGTKRAGLIKAMVAKSHGIPFNLSLYAEWANNDDDLSEEVVDRSEDVSTVMLIERIIKRIPYQPLRWIIRYGTVPRTLSIDFLRDVMREPLLDAMSGRALATGADDPQSVTEQDVWLAEPSFSFDAGLLWKNVLTYAAKQSWIAPGEQTPGQQSHEVMFRADILQPMRKLLREQKIFAELHERSRDWFAKQANNPDEWNAAILESLYHSVQLRTIEGHGGSDLLPTLRDLLDSTPLTADAALRAAVCEELRKPDFSDLTSSEQAYVCYRLAEARAAENNYFFTLPDAVQSLTSALTLAGDSSGTVLPRFAGLWKQATEGISLSEFLKAMNALPPEDTARAALLIAELFGNSLLVEEVLRSTTDISLNKGGHGIPPGVLAARLAGYIRNRDPSAAADYFVSAALDYGERGDQAKRTDMLRQASELELALGRLSRAESLLTQPGILDGLEVNLQLARVQLAQGNPGRALSLVGTGFGAQSSFPDSVPKFVQKFEIEAEGLGQRMFFFEATDAWNRAIKLATQLSDNDALKRIAAGVAKLTYWWLRIPPHSAPVNAQRMLRMQQNPSVAPAGESAVWRIVYGGGESDLWRRVALSGELGGQTPRECVRIILALSKVVSPFPEKRWQELVAYAEGIPRSARAAALAEPVLEGEPPILDPAIRDKLVEVFRHEPEGEIEGAWYGLWYGELIAWLGLHTQAVAVLEQRVPKLTTSAYGEGWRAAVYRRRRQIEQRIRRWTRDTQQLPQPYPPPDPDPAQLWSDFWEHTPFRAAAALVENAERAFEARRFDLMEDCLQRAKAGLDTVDVVTEFHALASRLGADSRASSRSAPAPAAVPFGVHAAERPADEPVDFHVVEMRNQSGRVVVRAAGDQSERMMSVESATLETLLRVSQGIPRRLVGMSIERMVIDLDEFLLQSEIRNAKRRTALKIPLSPFCCAPWELAFRDGPVPFRLPSEWNEAESIAQTQAEWRGTGDYAAEPVLFQTMSGQDKESPALHCYLALPSQIRRRFEEARGKLDAHVLYIASSFVEIPNIHEPALAGIEWTSSTVAYQISNVFAGARPLVILDTPLPPTSTDFMHQLMMRNYFAHALADSGAVSGVLATGLRPLPGMAEVQQLLLKTISTPLQSKLQLFDEIVRHTDALGLQRFDALFTANPHGPICGPPRA